MNKAFWSGFRDGYLRGFKFGIPFAVGLILGLVLGSWSHPYEECKRKYTTHEDISECMWIKTNG